jgi:tetratricopeptide (TPR) repeat protein
MSRFGNLEFEGRTNRQAEETALLSDEARCWQQAETALRGGDFESALRQFARVLEHNPQNSAAWAGQVRMLLELGEFAEAKRWADNAAERFPHEAEVLAAKAVALARLGDHQAALAFSDAALAEGAQTPYVWLARGDVLLARAEKRADYCFTRACSGAPLDWLWPWLASRVHYFHRKFSLALKLINQAMSLDGSQAVVWTQMGRCQFALGLAGAAKASFAQAGQLNPACPDAQRALDEWRERGLWSRVAGGLRRWWPG